MASYDFGLVEADISRKLGIDADSIGASTTPLRTADVTDALAAGCSEAMAAAYARGVVPDADLLTSDPDSHDKLKRLAMSRAVADLALAHGRLTEVYVTWWERYWSLKRELAAHPGELGTADPGISGITTQMDDYVAGDAYEIGGIDWTGDKVF